MLVLARGLNNIFFIHAESFSTANIFQKITNLIESKPIEFFAQSLIMSDLPICTNLLNKLHKTYVEVVEVISKYCYYYFYAYEDVSLEWFLFKTQMPN